MVKTIRTSRIQLGWEGKQQARLGFIQAGESETSLANALYSGVEGHLLTVAPTGAGKGRSAILPTLITYPGSVIVVDPKGEAAAITARQRRKFGRVVVIDPFHQVTTTPDTFNPLDLHKVSSNSVVEQALLISDLLQQDYNPSGREQFWDNRGTALLSGVLAFVLSAKPDYERHLGTLKNIFSSDDICYTLAVALDTQKQAMDAFAYKEIAQVLQLPDLTRGGVIATAQQHVYLFDDENVLNSIKATSFDLEALVRGEPITIYLVLPPTKLSSHGVLLRLWIASLLTAMFERETLPELPTLFMLDEAAQLGTLEILRTAMTLMRGYGVRCWTFWQDLSQLKHLYPHDWQTIINNAAVLQTFGITTNLMARDLSDVLGDVSPQALLKLERNQQILVQPGGQLDITTKLDYLQDEQYQGLYDPHPMFGKKHTTKLEPNNDVLEKAHSVSRVQWELENDIIPALGVSPRYLYDFKAGSALDNLLAKLTQCPHTYPFSTEEWAAQHLLKHFKTNNPGTKTSVGVREVKESGEHPYTALIVSENGQRTLTFSHSVAHTISLSVLRALLEQRIKEDSGSQIERWLTEAKDAEWFTEQLTQVQNVDLQKNEQQDKAEHKDKKLDPPDKPI
jgi:type IV secretion system protein VirD4